MIQLTTGSIKLEDLRHEQVNMQYIYILKLGDGCYYI